MCVPGSLLWNNKYIQAVKLHIYILVMSVDVTNRFWLPSLITYDLSLFSYRYWFWGTVEVRRTLYKGTKLLFCKYCISLRMLCLNYSFTPYFSTSRFITVLIDYSRDQSASHRDGLGWWMTGKNVLWLGLNLAPCVWFGHNDTDDTLCGVQQSGRMIAAASQTLKSLSGTEQVLKRNWLAVLRS